MLLEDKQLKSQGYRKARSRIVYQNFEILKVALTYFNIIVQFIMNL